MNVILRDTHEPTCSIKLYGRIHPPPAGSVGDARLILTDFRRLQKITAANSIISFDFQRLIKLKPNLRQLNIKIGESQVPLKINANLT